MKEKDYIRIDPDSDDRYPLINATSLPGINTPEIAPPDPNPPVPNRAWTAMRMGKDIDALTDEERRMLYYVKDDII